MDGMGYVSSQGVISNPPDFLWEMSLQQSWEASSAFGGWTPGSDTKGGPGTGLDGRFGDRKIRFKGNLG